MVSRQFRRWIWILVWQIVVNPTTGFLCLLYGSKLSWHPHLVDLKFKFRKSQDILRVISHKYWGADLTLLLRLYLVLVRSKIDYGCGSYGFSRQSKLRTIDTIHHTGIRIAKVSAIVPSLVYCARPANHVCITYAACLEVACLLEKPEQLGHLIVFSNWFKQRYNTRLRTVRAFKLWIRDMYRDLCFEAPSAAKIYCVT